MSGLTETAAEPTRGGRAYPAGISVAVLASFLTVWTTVVRDDGTGAAYFMIILAAAAGAVAAWFRPAGMARAMVGVAVMQVALGLLTATAPSTASMPGGAFKVLLFTGFFTALWLVSATFFRVAAKAEQRASSNR